MFYDDFGLVHLLQPPLGSPGSPRAGVGFVPRLRAIQNAFKRAARRVSEPNKLPADTQESGQRGLEGVKSRASSGRKGMIVFDWCV